MEKVLLVVGLIIWVWIIGCNVKKNMKNNRSSLYVAVKRTISVGILNIGYSVMATILCLFLSFSSDEIEKPEKKARVVVEFARIRSADNLKDESVIGKLEYNTQLTIVKELEKYYVVNYEYSPTLNMEVYIHKSNVKLLD